MTSRLPLLRNNYEKSIYMISIENMKMRDKKHTRPIFNSLLLLRSAVFISTCCMTDPFADLSPLRIILFSPPVLHTAGSTLILFALALLAAFTRPPGTFSMSTGLQIGHLVCRYLCAPLVLANLGHSISSLHTKDATTIPSLVSSLVYSLAGGAAVHVFTVYACISAVPTENPMSAV